VVLALTLMVVVVRVKARAVVVVVAVAVAVAVAVVVCRKPPRYVPYKCTYVPYDGTFGASNQGQMLDV
jgi:hypothetical protein